MTFKIDENLPVEIKDDLIAAGHSADTVVEEGLAGAPDVEILRVSRQEQRALLTLDKGIADLRSIQPADYAGIVLFRPVTQGRGATLSFVRRHLPALLAADLNGRLLVVTDAGIRIR
jgi:hypothetical protein